MNAPWFVVEGDVAKVMRDAATALYKQPGHALVQVATGTTEFLLGIYDADHDRMAVFNGPALIAALRKSIAT
jgi:Ni,Fe-hydrogenase III small subunit